MDALNSGAQASSDYLPGPYRVMVVDDSVVARGLIARALESDSEVEVVSTASSGEQAVAALTRYKVEVVVLDIEMPKLDGLASLPLLTKADPDDKIIMVSSPTKRNASLCLRALSEGAADYVLKPSTARHLATARDFQRELLDKVKALGAARRGGNGRVSARVSTELPIGARHRMLVSNPITFRRPAVRRPEALAIAASTGGPQALMEVLAALGPKFPLPILVTQHMPPTFTSILAERLAKTSGRPSREAADRETVLPGHTYIAPGDSHMLVESLGSRRVIRLDDGPPENFCRPSADPMLRSMARAYEGRVLGLVLTGMGQDGLRGGRLLIEAGGTLLAQDSATSIVWGMPGAVAAAGLCAAVLPLKDIAPYVNRLMPSWGGR
jgi:two-component system chemotaxis response regulator CheB